MNHVLVLNATYEPLGIVSVRRAVLLLLKEKGRTGGTAEAWLHSSRVALPVPAVAAWPTIFRIHFSLPGFSAHSHGPRPLYLPVLWRTAGRARLTLDHVVPRSHGGETRWDNVVTACGPCNRRKGNRTPAEAAMTLHCQPRRPRYIALTLLEGTGAPEVWNKYMYF
jgi:hypothetical protein